MALLIEPSGHEREVKPKAGKFQLEELYALLECQYVEWVTLRDGMMLLFDESGKTKRAPVNAKASKILHEAGGMPGDFIAGKVLLVNTRKEMD